MTDSTNLLAAAHFAADKHRDQRRKDSSASPYINHPLAVAEVLSRHGVSDVVPLQAALLHDTIEDTETTVSELNDAFGVEVLGVVLEVTDDKRLEKAERKRRQIEKAPGLSEYAKLVKLGDKICNVADVAASPPAGWDHTRRIEYLDWTEAVIRGCRGVHPALEAHYDRTLADARVMLGGAAASASAPALDPTSESVWKIIHEDLFDRDVRPTVDAEGQGLADGLSELWARYLISQIGPGGVGGLARFSLSWSGAGVQMPPASKAGSQVREWVFGAKPDTSRGYRSAGDSELLDLIGRVHAGLLVAGRSGDEVLDLAGAADTKEAFAEALGALLNV